MSSEKTVLDVLGLRCPIPVQRLRLAIREADAGNEIHLIGDDSESLHDIPALLVRLGLPAPEIIEQGDSWLFKISV